MVDRAELTNAMRLLRTGGGTRLALDRKQAGSPGSPAKNMQVKFTRL
jgi:hypothetical protein